MIGEDLLSIIGCWHFRENWVIHETVRRTELFHDYSSLVSRGINIF